MKIITVPIALLLMLIGLWLLFLLLQTVSTFQFSPDDIPFLQLFLSQSATETATFSFTFPQEVEPLTITLSPRAELVLFGLLMLFSISLWIGLILGILRLSVELLKTLSKHTEKPIKKEENIV